ncbi:MAG TPA: sigma-70 family RNA polymerase sigma factor [Fodinibius sp.]|nr:sigma-70 family RNA polymerase sigma factor [Fodinibius sp.]
MVLGSPGSMFPYHKDQDIDSHKDSVQLWDSLCTGDREALNALFRIYYSALFSYGVKLIADKELVKDGIQKLFLRLWRTHDSLGRAQSVENYLLYSLRRILLRNIKKHKNRLERNRTYIDELFSDSFLMEEIEINLDLEDRKKRKLLNAINTLNGRQKEALFLRYYHGLTNREIADVMEINVQSVRNHLHRAIKSLRSILLNKIPV